MKSSNLVKNSQCFTNSIEPRTNPLEVWRDILTYSLNLTGNWPLSKQIFHFYIVPTAEKNPALFARWVMCMVKKSGVKIKSKAAFIEALKYLRRNNNKTNKDGIRQAIYHLFEAGLHESAYASRALSNTA